MEMSASPERGAAGPDLEETLQTFLPPKPPEHVIGMAELTLCEAKQPGMAQVAWRQAQSRVWDPHIPSLFLLPLPGGGEGNFD